MNDKRIFCSRCGADITRTMKFYDNRKNRYCYDCYSLASVKEKKEKPHKKTDEKASKRKIKKLSKMGYKPSEIAEKTGYTTKEVYEVLAK